MWRPVPGRRPGATPPTDPAHPGPWRWCRSVRAPGPDQVLGPTVYGAQVDDKVPYGPAGAGRDGRAEAVRVYQGGEPRHLGFE